MAEEKIQLSRSRMRKKILSVVFLLILNSILLIPYSVSAGTLNKPSNLLVLNTGLVGWWTMDGKNTINNISDSSGQGITGYLVSFGGKKIWHRLICVCQWCVR